MISFLILFFVNIKIKNNINLKNFLFKTKHKKILLIILETYHKLKKKTVLFPKIVHYCIS